MSRAYHTRGPVKIEVTFGVEISWDEIYEAAESYLSDEERPTDNDTVDMAADAIANELDDESNYITWINEENDDPNCGDTYLAWTIDREDWTQDGIQGGE